MKEWTAFFRGLTVGLLFALAVSCDETRKLRALGEAIHQLTNTIEELRAK